MRLIFLLILTVQICMIPLKAEWRLKADKYLGKIKDYEGYVVLIEEFGSSKEQLLILSWLYSRIGDKVNEKRCVASYFNSRGKTPALNFLKDVTKIEVYEFLADWRRSYPKDLVINMESEKFRLNSDSVLLKFTIFTSVPAEVTAWKGNLLLSDATFIRKGSNRFPVKISAPFKDWENLMFVFKTPKIDIRKRVVVRKRVLKPGSTSVNLLGKEIALGNRKRKKEFQIKERFVKERYFDKKHFFKRAFPNIILGSLIIGVNRIYIDRGGGVHQRSGDLSSLNGSTLVAGLGFSLKGVIELIGSFRTRYRKEEIKVPLKEAIDYNRILRKLRQEAINKVFVEYRLIR